MMETVIDKCAVRSARRRIVQTACRTRHYRTRRNLSSKSFLVSKEVAVCKGSECVCANVDVYTRMCLHVRGMNLQSGVCTTQHFKTCRNEGMKAPVIKMMGVAREGRFHASALVRGRKVSIICHVRCIIYKVVFRSAGCRGKSIACTSSVSLIFNVVEKKVNHTLFRQATI